jgi:hypothetical protein
MLEDLPATRENYHMVDDEFQLPVLAARYLADTSVGSDRKRAFLLSQSQGTSHLVLLVRELALVSSWTRAYVLQQEAVNLVSFPKRDSIRWRSASWRDSDAGYSGGRFAMDINAIWAPAALEATADILRSLTALGFTAARLDSLVPEIRESALREYAADSTALSRAVTVWKGARRHFTLTLTPRSIRAGTAAKLASLPQAERRYWQRVLRSQREPGDSLTFLALALDSAGKPIPVVNTDPATELFLDSDLEGARALTDIEPFLRAYPVGLFVEGLGPLVANDAYASPAIWKRFEEDRYHGPRVVWGREVNLLLLGLANRLTKKRSPEIEEALRRSLAAVNASGLQHNELWSYEIEGRRLKPVRYGTSSDVQLWNTTNLVVQYMLSRLPH